MKNLSIISLSILLLFVSSCAKMDKSLEVAGQLDGSWNLTSLIEDGLEQLEPYITAQMTFSNIVEAKGDYVYTLYFNEVSAGSSTGNFEILTEGTIITLSDDADPTASPEITTITFTSDTNMVITATDPDDGTVTIISATKI
tara:strand:+ start:768 stop:1193 length:426 start_codon:yes stop_codon:yes gene_type:complete